uniref:Uncharacterized protein n=1 Tax=Arundo donax TaxID=35708 RepID=A0A0A9GR52_ARUDO
MFPQYCLRSYYLVAGL